jgi:hypothetical protein
LLRRRSEGREFIRALIERGSLNPLWCQFNLIDPVQSRGSRRLQQILTLPQAKTPNVEVRCQRKPRIFALAMLLASPNKTPGLASIVSPWQSDRPLLRRIPPLVLVSSHKLIGCVRSPGSSSVIREILRVVVFPALKNRLGGFPGGFNHV